MLVGSKELAQATASSREPKHSVKMIGKLNGIVDSQGEDFVILDVQGVGYIVHCSGRTLQKLPRPGEAAVLAIETQMREDSIKLFGFASETERDWFRLLQSVQGVGAKVALAIQTVLDVAELASAIACQDKAAIARAPGVGPKLAARIASELKDKAAVSGAAGCGGRACRARWRPARRGARRRSRPWSISVTVGRRPWRRWRLRSRHLARARPPPN